MKKPAYQCKIFVDVLADVLERRVNEWFLENPGICVFDVFYRNDRIHSVFILYDPCEEK